MQKLQQRKISNDIVFLIQIITGVTDAPDRLCKFYFNNRGSVYNLRDLDLVKIPVHRTTYGMHEPLTRTYG